MSAVLLVGLHAAMLGFAAPRRPPRWMPQWLWNVLPTELTLREIVIAPAAVGLTEAGLIGLVQRFAGTMTTTDYYWSVD